MTLQDAKPYLDKPVFGDPDCIAALAFFRLMESVKSARIWWHGYSDKGPDRSSSAVELMDEYELEDELERWHWKGYSEEDSAA